VSQPLSQPDKVDIDDTEKCKNVWATKKTNGFNVIPVTPGFIANVQVKKTLNCGKNAANQMLSGSVHSVNNGSVHSK
jgi:hypothetical protein